MALVPPHVLRLFMYREEELWSALQEIGKPQELVFVRDKLTGVFREHCYIRYSSNADAHAARDLLEKVRYDIPWQDLLHIPFKYDGPNIVVWKLQSYSQCQKVWTLKKSEVENARAAT